MSDIAGRFFQKCANLWAVRGTYVDSSLHDTKRGVVWLHGQLDLHWQL